MVRVTQAGFDRGLDSRILSLGEETFVVMARPKKYSDKLAVRGVRVALESERPIAHIAADLGIHSETLRKRRLDLRFCSSSAGPGSRLRPR
jgi:hypothetical protein